MTIRNMILAGLFAAMLAVGSQVSLLLPFSPVPHTLQVIFVLLTGVVLGSRWGATAVIVWVLLGAFGLPVFSQGKAGAAVLAGPTGGFLLGFIMCALVVGWFCERADAGLAKTALILYGGLAVVYIVGLAGFMASFAFFLHKPMSWQQASAMAVLPFLPYDIVKTFLAAYIGVKVRKALRRAGYIKAGQ